MLENKINAYLRFDEEMLLSSSFIDFGTEIYEAQKRAKKFQLHLPAVT